MTKHKSKKKHRYGTCFYHLCEKKNVRLFRCKYCREYFCREHLYAKIPQAAPFRTTDADRHIEWDKKGGHPCFAYFDYKIRQEKEPSPMVIPEIKPELISSIQPDIEEETEKELQIEEKQEPSSIYESKDVEKDIKIRTPRSTYKTPLYKHPNKYIRWFFRKKHPHSRLRTHDFAINIALLIGLCFIFWMIYTNISIFNNIIILIFKLGSIILLILFFLILRYLYRSLKGLKYGIRGLANGYKTGAVIIFLLLCFGIYQSPGLITNPVSSFNYNSLNPFEINWNTDNNAGSSDGENGESEGGISLPDWDLPSLQPEINIQGLEQEIHILVNNERQKYGLSSLSYDNALANIARDHSQDMAANNFFDHYNLVGQGPTERAKAAGYNCYKDFGSYYMDGIAENIFQNWEYDSITYINGVPIYEWNSQSELASSTVSGWMNSPGHRANILGSSYDKEGIGVAINSDHKVYITQDFW